ncbi:matrixin family metalloprotease [Azospirillum sp. RWY-5-1]|uniref:Matrixin family metalloprotease n=1 Tax=Azospirillum oleiclasticum TaxID=2735135 RepID=A0ABX2TK41_9PROT|nr:matrixin family metalloprotease [Azospirillum oleiclasticum]NYZ24402.1 matrixin family metalloprotease [Azospirillum oleiclasticum]
MACAGLALSTDGKVDSASFQAYGTKWGLAGLGRSGGVVTWSFEAGSRDVGRVMPAGYRDLIAAAFRTWESVADIRFAQLADGATADIRIGATAMDGASGTLARAYYPTASSALGGDIEFDSAERWSIGTAGGTDIQRVAAHEIGHAIGLEHETAVVALMNPIYSEGVSGPLADDIAGAQAIYGAPAPDTRRPSFEAGFYLTVNADVRGALGAGNTEGAFEHYLRYGAREGRAPGPVFDETWYLAFNPDVARAVGTGGFLSGFQHWVENGQAERRSPGPLFDEAYYLGTHSDVAAAVAAGWLRSGAQHFAASGMAEGRDPGPAFDAGFYLSAYPDVAAAVRAGALPSAAYHYFLYGRTEGRLPMPAVVGNVGEPSGADLPASSATTGRVSIGGVVTGRVGSSGDRDWYALSLTAGDTVRVTLRGSASGGGTLGDPYLRIYSAGGLFIAGNDDSGGTLDSALVFRATVSGTHYAEAAAYSTGTGTYTLAVARSSSVTALGEA